MEDGFIVTLYYLRLLLRDFNPVRPFKSKSINLEMQVDYFFLCPAESLFIAYVLSRAEHSPTHFHYSTFLNKILSPLSLKAFSIGVFCIKSLFSTRRNESRFSGCTVAKASLYPADLR